MKPKWGGISKYMGLDNPSLLPFKLHCLYIRSSFCFQLQREWAVSSLLCDCVGESGSNSTKLLWFKGGWFPLFLQLRGKWCLLILGVFPKVVLIIKLFSYQEICWHSIYKLIFYKCLMCTLIIRFMKNLWDNLNLFKFVCVNMFLYFWELWMDYFVSILNMFWKTMASHD